MGYTERKLMHLVHKFCRDKDDLKSIMLSCRKKDLLTDNITY
jgi:hypothetical protein